MLSKLKLAQSIVRKLPIGLIVLDPDGLTIGWNDWMELHSGVSAATALGQGLGEIFPSLQGGHLLQAVRRVLATGQPVVFSRALHRSALPLFVSPGGRRAESEQQQPVEQAVELFAVSAEDGTRYCVLQVDDVTAAVHREQCLREKTREAEQARNAERTFLTNMSHEIRTPMNGVLGVAELLTHTALEPQQREYVQTIRDSGVALLGIINDILDFSKMEAGKLELETLPTDVRALSSQIVELLRPQVNDKGISIRAVLGEDTPRWVRVDPTRTRQILINLLGNAIKFTEQGSIELSGRYSAESSTLTFEVRDTGIGIADPSVLFRQFAQADVSTSRRFGGTGLGLSICKSLAEMMGGNIQVESEVGVGSCFTLELHAPVETTPVTEPVVEAATASTRPGRALLVEDNKTNQLVATKLLGLLGWRVDVANNGVEAVEQVQQGVHYDVIIMDCQMPEMDGYEATRRIRAMPGAVGKVFIVAMTAHVFKGELERCLAAGMDRYLTKPVNLKRLSAVLDERTAPAVLRTAEG